MSDNSNKIIYETKPMMLFVRLVEKTDTEYFGKDTERIIDVQITNEQALELIEILKTRPIDSYSATKSFRLKGRLIL